MGMEKGGPVGRLLGTAVVLVLMLVLVVAILVDVVVVVVVVPVVVLVVVVSVGEFDGINDGFVLGIIVVAKPGLDVLYPVLLLLVVFDVEIDHS